MKRRVIVAIGALLTTSRTVFALSPALDVSQYAHTSWKIRDGFGKGYIKSIAQTPDGYLWLATDFGLLRFDGVRSVSWQPPPGQSLPSSEISSLLTARDGTLWIATAKGLASWKDGRLTEVAQLAGQRVFPLMQDRDGAVWAGTIALNDAKLCAVRGPVVQCDGGAGRFGNAVVGLHEDSSGALWVSVSGGLWRWKPGPPAFHPMPAEHDSIQSFDEDDGRLLMGTLNGVRQLVDGKGEDYPVPRVGRQLRIDRLLRDRDGGLWIGTRSQGVVHLHRGRADGFMQIEGLSGNSVTALFEDREGTVWVATSGGLDRFRDVAVATFGASQGLSSGRVFAVMVGRSGNVWIGTDGGLNRWTSPGFAAVPTDNVRSHRTRRAVPNSLFEDSRGRVWISSVDGIGYLKNGGYVAQPGVPGGSGVHAIAEDRGGDLWIAHQDGGLFRVSGDRTIQSIPWTAFGQRAFATALAADPAGRGVWAGFQKGDVVHFSDGRVVASYTASAGAGEDRVNTLRFDRHGALWAATESGLSRLNNGRLAKLTSSNGLPCDGVHWEIPDDNQSVWLFMPCGLVSVPASDLDAWAADVDNDRNPTRAVKSTLFVSADGVPSQASAIGYSPQVGKSDDGKIWFVTLDGLSVVDPRHVPFNSLAPPVHIDQVTADRRIYDTSSVAGLAVLRLPPLTRDLQIDYTALSLAAPEKMQFRYKLEGHDAEWQDAGSRRQAFYTNLPPGSYRFRVIAANNSGVWNESGAAASFVVAPAYYQTPWFLALSAATVVALVWAAHRVRLRVVERHEREITALNERMMKAQEQERIRIAGELHDGVMQEMLAVTMMLGTAKRRVPDDSDAKTTIDKAQQKLIRVGTDIRQLSHDLHPPVLQEAGLPEAVRTYCEQFGASSGVPVSCEADDRLRDLSRGSGLALFRIVQEALGNAAKHAQAGRIIVSLRRVNDSVVLSVSDDGRGFDTSRLGTAGGLGFVMMRERASQLNGTFEFDSAPGRGTRIRVAIPFR